MHTPGARPSQHAICPEHGGPRPCPACAPKDPPAGFFDEIREQLGQAKTKDAKSAADERARQERKP